jgi:hypothetical protein
MSQYVLMFTGIQYISIFFHIHWNSACIDTFSYSREFNITIRLTFIAIEHLSICFLYSLEFSMYRYVFMQKISTYRYVLMSEEILNISIRSSVYGNSKYIETFLCLQKF